jgi:hypothetical protein
MEVSVRSIMVTEELRRQCRKNTAPFVVLIACLYRSGIKKYVRTNRTDGKNLAPTERRDENLQGGWRKPAKSK